MTITFIILGIIVLLGVIIASWAISTTNNFNRLEIKIEEGLSGIEVALEKRYDLLTKLLDTTKAFMKHESEIITQTISLRKGMNVSELNEVSSQMDQLSEKINITAEAYPDLRSSEVFQQLQRGIFDAEEHLQAARRLYNSNVTAYNTAIVLFPAKLLAGSRTEKEFITIEAHKRNDVEMKFE